MELCCAVFISSEPDQSTKPHRGEVLAAQLSRTEHIIRGKSGLLQAFFGECFGDGRRSIFGKAVFRQEVQPSLRDLALSTALPQG